MTSTVSSSYFQSVMNSRHSAVAGLEGSVFMVSLLRPEVSTDAPPRWEGLHQSQASWVPPSVRSRAWRFEHTAFSGLCKPCRGGQSKKGGLQGQFPTMTCVPPLVRRSAARSKHQGDRSAAQLSPICWKPVEKSPDLVGPQPFHCQNEGLGLHKPRIISL